jgi:hypothetical protein
MSRSIDEILAPKPEARLRIYAYTIDDAGHKGLLKVGQTTRDVKKRVGEQLKTAAIKNFKIVLDEVAEREDGSSFTDHEVRDALPANQNQARAQLCSQSFPPRRDGTPIRLPCDSRLYGLLSLFPQ